MTNSAGATCPRTPTEEAIVIERSRPSKGLSLLGAAALLTAAQESANSIASAPPSDHAQKLIATFNSSLSPAQFDLAYGAAYAPDLDSPLLIRMPYHLEQGKAVRDAAVWKIWDGGFGGLPDKIAKYGANLRSLRGIGIDYGTQDEYAWILQGSHEDQLGDRMANHMLPFMIAKLATE
jgi:hypothetical protein